MKKERLVAFFDAMIAIIMTILVLELPKIHGTSFEAVWKNRIHYFAYITTFLLFATFWDTHHTVFDKVEKITSKISRIQMLLLFVDTLFPYITYWVSENSQNYMVECVYMFFMMIANILYSWLCDELIKADIENTELKNTITKLRRHKLTTIIQISSLIIGLINPVLILLAEFIALVTWYIPVFETKKKNSKK